MSAYNGAKSGSESNKRFEFDHALRVYSDVTQMASSLENPTPLVRLNRISATPDFAIHLKMERYNPFGSVKDRIAFEMLRALDTQGRKVIEPSSGNTGIALASLANSMGIPVEVAVPQAVPEEKKVMLKVLGVKLWEADDALCPVFPNEGARGLVNALVSSPGTKSEYVSPNQYENQLNVQAHYRATGPEIWKQTAGGVTHFFAAMGTCGTISGVGKFLKEQNPDVNIIGVEPASADHKLPGMKRISDLTEEYVPKILDSSVIDSREQVSDEDAYRTAMVLARKEGILVGPTTGAVLSVALRYSRSNSGLAVVISPDDAFKYAGFYKEFLDSGKAAIERADEHDFSDLVCPMSKVRTVQVIESLNQGDRVSIVLGDMDSLKSVLMELRTRGLKPDFKREDENRFRLAIVK